MLSAKDFELLLPWYLNGTLTDREHALVTAYLKAHPEEDARVQWHASLRTSIKEQADELPEDLGRDRVLATVRQDISRAPKSQRTLNERQMAASVAAWAHTLRRLRDALGRWGTVPRVAALTCVALVVGAVVMTMIPAQMPLVDPMAADSRTPIPTAADRQAPAVAEEPREAADAGTRQAPFAAKQIKSRSGQPPGVARATGEPPGKRRPTQELPQSARPSTPPEPNESGLAAEGPGGAASLSSNGSGSAVPGAALSPPGPETGSQAAVETSTPDKHSVVADGSEPATTAGLPAVQSKQREIVPPSRLAISGKDNTSCPSTTKQREDALRAANPDQPVRTPTTWLEYIKELRAVGCREAADKEWVEFRKKYPNEKAPPELEISK